MRQLLYKVYYIRFQVPFYLWQIKFVEKHSNWQKYYVTGCRIHKKAHSFSVSAKHFQTVASKIQNCSKSIFWNYRPIIHLFETIIASYLTLFKMSILMTAYWTAYSSYPTMMNLDTVIPYLKKIWKIYKSRDTALKFYWHQHLFNRN